MGEIFVDGFSDRSSILLTSIYRALVKHSEMGVGERFFIILLLAYIILIYSV